MTQTQLCHRMTLCAIIAVCFCAAICYAGYATCQELDQRELDAAVTSIDAPLKSPNVSLLDTAQRGLKSPSEVTK